jgi:polyhydroxybutyrate depolymerase
MKHIVPVTRKSQGAVLPTRLFATAAVLFALAALSACGDSRPTGPTPLPPLPEFDGRFTFVDTMVVDRRERTALVALPASYDHETRIPVLFGYHGGGGSAAQMQAQTRLDSIADEFGFALVYVDAYDGFWVTPCPECDNEGRDPMEEIDYAYDLIRSLSRSHALDPDRVYATGFSMGGFFLNNVGCLPDLPFQGIAPVAAGARRTMPGTCLSTLSRRRLPVLITNGMVDLSVPPEGGDDWLGVDELTAWWRQWNGCDETSSAELEPELAGESAPQIVRTEWSRCGDGTKVQVQKVERIGHWWLTEDNNPSRVDYGRTIVSFFGLDR